MEHPPRGHAVLGVRRGDDSVTVRVAPIEMPRDRIEPWRVGREMAKRRAASTAPANPRPDFSGDIVRD
jgi:hypothetical protein